MEKGVGDSTAVDNSCSTPSVVVEGLSGRHTTHSSAEDTACPYPELDIRTPILGLLNVNRGADPRAQTPCGIGRYVVDWDALSLDQDHRSGREESALADLSEQLRAYILESDHVGDESDDDEEPATPQGEDNGDRPITSEQDGDVTSNVDAPLNGECIIEAGKFSDVSSLV